MYMFITCTCTVMYVIIILCFQQCYQCTLSVDKKVWWIQWNVQVSSSSQLSVLYNTYHIIHCIMNLTNELCLNYNVHVTLGRPINVKLRRCILEKSIQSPETCWGQLICVHVIQWLLYFFNVGVVFSVSPLLPKHLCCCVLISLRPLLQLISVSMYWELVIDIYQTLWWTWKMEVLSQLTLDMHSTLQHRYMCTCTCIIM